MICRVLGANFLLQVVSPDFVEHFAHNHHHQIWECLARILDVVLSLKASASLPLSMGGLGLRSAVRTRGPAHWSSWADCLPMVHAHPDVAVQMVALLEGDPEIPSLGTAAEAPGNWWRFVVSNLMESPRDRQTTDT